MAQPRFVQRLSEASVPLDSILLDPNNPRLIGLDGFEGVEERRIAEKSIQENTHNKLNSVRAIDQESLSASIEKSGLLGVDRVVIRPIPDKDEGGNALFVVVEGNRRVAACKTLLLQHKSGEKTLSDDILESINNPRVLVLSEDEAEEARLDQWVIQGIRHISGIRPWGAYQAARTIEAMLSKLGYAESDVASALSISIQRVRRSMRVLAALQQMRESDDYSEYAGPDMYAYFDEALKRPAIRRWLGWSEDAKLFEEDERLQHFYSWITPDDELDGRRRIPVAESLRKLDDVIQEPMAVDILNEPGKTIDDALRVIAPQIKTDWTEPLQRALRALDAVPISDLEELPEEKRQLIEQLIALAQRRLDQAAKFQP